MIKEYLRRLKSRPILIIAVGLLGFLIIRNLMMGGLNREYSFERSIEDGEKVIVSGQIVGQDLKDNKSILILEASNILYNSKKYSAGKILFYTSDNSFYSIGSQIRGQGKLKLLRHATNPGQFDEYSYYKSININSKITGTIEEIDNSKASSYKTFLSRLRRNLSEVIDKSDLNSKESGIVKAMLLGEKTELDEEEKTLYKNAGIIHLISISGLHITIVGMGLYKLLRKRGCSFWLCAVCASAVMISFVIMTGASVSSQRALIMFIILLLANVLGRTQDPLNSISIAAIVLISSNPVIINNPSFVLTFTAVIGVNTLCYSIKKLTDLYEGVFKKPLAAVGFGLGLWIFTMPVVLHYYYEIPTYSIFVNLIVVPFAPVILIGAMLGAALGLIHGIFFESISRGIFLLPKGVLMANDFLSRLVSRLPEPVRIYGQPKLIAIILYYIIMFGLILMLNSFVRQLNEKKKIKILKILVSNILIMSAAFFVITIHPRMNTKISILDVGQGDCILVQCKSGENILIDGGSSSVNEVGKYRIVPCLKSLGISKVDRVIMTHPDNDHINGLDTILASNISVDEINVASVCAKSEKIAEMFDNKNSKDKEGRIYKIESTKVKYLNEGDSFACGDTKFQILNPRGDTELTDNEASIVILITEGKVKSLLTGDVEGRGEEYLFSKIEGVKVDFLKVAHHGSKNSSSSQLLKSIKPLIAVISAGKNNRYGHPHKETIERLKAVNSKVYNTAEKGYIELKLNYDYINVRYYNE